MGNWLSVLYTKHSAWDILGTTNSQSASSLFHLPQEEDIDGERGIGPLSVGSDMLALRMREEP